MQKYTEFCGPQLPRVVTAWVVRSRRNTEVMAFDSKDRAVEFMNSILREGRFLNLVRRETSDIYEGCKEA